MTARRRTSRKPKDTLEENKTENQTTDTTDTANTGESAQKPSTTKKRSHSRRRSKPKTEDANQKTPDAAPDPKPASQSNRHKRTSKPDQQPQDNSSADKPTTTASREMIVNTAQEQECRIAVLESGRLEELYTERAGGTTHVGNIYKGVVTNVEPSIQACFIDFGIGQNGFLHISDLQSTYFPNNANAPKERVGRKRPRRDRPPIQECLKRGQELIVQVIKEGIGTKGPTLTTYLSIPGRFLVLMPGMNRLGISRKIEDESIRAKAREILQQLEPPKDTGFIIRTAGIDRTKRDLQRDMNYLLRLWEKVSQKIKSAPAPAAIYQESDLVIRTVRDVFNSNITRIICDTEATAKKIRDFLSIAMPRTKCRISYYDGETPIFAKHKIEQEIERIHSRHVPLRSGGSIVIDSTEAIVAIDVNSGKYRAHEDAETTSYKINIEAATEIARQLRLRDLGGVIIMDFIDMIQEKHRRAVEKALRDAVSSDRARTKILRTSQFGIIEMTRQRMRPSLKRSTFMDCPHCRGTGLMKTPESMTIEVMRQIQSCVSKSVIAQINVSVAPDVASHLLNRNRAAITELEKTNHKTITVLADRNLSNDQVQFNNLDDRGSIIPYKE
ncbi:MAG: Rne/Rng family ribonuclease [Sedimentisphaerales bacterium]|nr:Rne/Rng family ribonuclease [Sedimentisphaerales bacterium]